MIEEWCYFEKPLKGWYYLNMLAKRGHMFGYDLSYYGYLWSKVYAIDFFFFFQSNPLDKELGMKLRKEILTKCGALDGLYLLRNFMDKNLILMHIFNG